MGSFLANVKFHVKNLEENCVGAQSKKTFLSWMCREKGQEKLNHLGSADSTSQGRLSLLPSEGEAIKIRAMLQE
jgi:hypothetical protein